MANYRKSIAKRTRKAPDERTTDDAGNAPSSAPSPPKRVSSDVAEVWRELTNGTTHLTPNDVPLLETVCRLIAAQRQGEMMGAAYLAQINAALNNLLLTPSARRHIQAPPSAKNDPLAKYS